MCFRWWRRRLNFKRANPYGFVIDDHPDFYVPGTRNNYMLKPYRDGESHVLLDIRIAKRVWWPI